MTTTNTGKQPKKKQRIDDEPSAADAADSARDDIWGTPIHTSDDDIPQDSSSDDDDDELPQELSSDDDMLEEFSFPWTKQPL